MPARVAECGWFPDRSGQVFLEDIAVLLLDEPLDHVPNPGLAVVEPPDRADCYAYGSLSDYTGIGQSAWAMIARNLNDRGWHQLDADTTKGGYFVQRGFSGAPVLDPLGNTVWGMVVEVDKGAESERRLVAFALPAEALRDAHAAVRRCARKANWPAPDIRLHAEGPLEPLVRETAVALAAKSAGGTAQASGLADPADRAIGEDRLDAVRTLAAAGDDPARRDLAAASLRGLSVGNIADAERFFTARPPGPPEPRSARPLEGWLAPLRD